MGKLTQNKKNLINHNYWALVKFEVLADHFMPCYSFSYFKGSDKKAVAKKIIREFNMQFAEAVSAQEPDEQLDEDLRELKIHFGNALAKIGSDPKKDTSLKKIEASIIVGWPTFSFIVLADGPWQSFTDNLFAELENDEYFSEFLEFIKEEVIYLEKGSESRKLFDQYKILKEMSPESIRKSDGENFLKLLSRVVYNNEG